MVKDKIRLNTGPPLSNTRFKRSTHLMDLDAMRMVLPRLLLGGGHIGHVPVKPVEIHKGQGET